jgi:Zn-dependent peptidase ImmA (M78 family)/transcriptional regulator with XRE-family HTH domain
MEDDVTEVRGLPRTWRIRSARELRGYSQGEAVGLMKAPVSSAALSQIESGKVRPTESTLVDLAQALEVPVEFFYSQWPGDVKDGEAPPIYFRDLRATSQRERRRAQSLALLLNDLVSAIEHHVRLPSVQLPQIPVEAGVQRVEIERIAETVRKDWGLGAEPIVHVVREIERRGIPVARLSMGHRHIDAFAVPFGRRPIVLLTDDKENNYVRSRSDAAHELGHLVMHRGRGEQDRTIEQQAHSFAASFLFPMAAALEELPHRIDGQGWIRLAELKRRWGISMASLVRRMRDLRISSEDDYRNAMKFMSAKGWRITEPGDRELGPAEAPLLLERSLRTIEVHKDISPEELVESAHLPLADTMALVKASHDGRPIVEF